MYYYRRQALRKWKERAGSNATYSNLITVFENTGNRCYADEIKKLMESWHTRDKKEVQQLDGLKESHCSKIKVLSADHPLYPESDPLIVVTKAMIIDHELNGSSEEGNLSGQLDPFPSPVLLC